MRRVLAALIAAAALAATGTATAGQDAPGGSLLDQVRPAADDAFGDDAARAVVRAYDRGYELLQIVEGLLDRGLAADGTIADEEGSSVEPFRDAAGVIEGDSGSRAGAGVPARAARVADGDASGETIALAVLARGTTRTTNNSNPHIPPPTHPAHTTPSATLV